MSMPDDLASLAATSSPSGAGTSSRAVARRPTDDSVAAALCDRARQDRPFTRIGSTILVSVNPRRPPPASLDADAEAHARDEDGSLSPHPFQLAGLVHSVVKTGRDQAIVYSGASGSGKTFASSLVTSQIIRLATNSDPAKTTRKQLKLASQFEALETVLTAFGAARTPLCSSASRHGRLLEIQVDRNGGLAGGRVLTFGLDKRRVCRIGRGDRAPHVFYQLLAGATPGERQEIGLRLEPSDYVVLSASGNARLPGDDLQGSADRVAFSDLRQALDTVGFRNRHVTAITRLLSSILLLGDLTFAAREGHNARPHETAWIEQSARPSLEVAAALLGLTADDLEAKLVARSRWVRKELITEFLSPSACNEQRDALMSSLYGILFAYLVESINARICPADIAPEVATIMQLDMPGFQTRSAAARTGSANRRSSTLLDLIGDADGHTELCYNLSAEVLQTWLGKRRLDDELHPAKDDSVPLVPVERPFDKSETRVDLLRGPQGLVPALSRSVKDMRKGKVAAGVEADQSFIATLKAGAARTSTAFIAEPPGGQGALGLIFGIAHFAGNVTYDARSFVERDADVLDADLVALLRRSDNAFVSKLLSGPGLAAEAHPRDPLSLVAAQVSSMPFRSLPGTSIANVDVHPIATQLDATLDAALKHLQHARTLWQVICINPNDAGPSVGSLDVKSIKAQVSALGIGDLCPRQRTDYAVDVPIRDVGASDRRELDERGLFAAAGSSRLWLSGEAWRFVRNTAAGSADLQQRRMSEAKILAEHLRAQARLEGNDDAATIAETETDEEPPQLATVPFSSGENLLQYGSPGAEHVFNPRRSSEATLLNPGTPQQGDTIKFWSPGMDDKSPQTFDVTVPTLEKGGTSPSTNRGVPGSPTKAKRKSNAVEVTESTTARRLWLMLVWGLTWWMPDVALKLIGRLKRPDVRIAWREKVALCMLIFLACGTVVFYIVFFGKLICPQFDYAWNVKELGYHASQDDFFVAVRGEVYDITKFWRGQHSDIVGNPVTSQDMLSLAGQDLTNYFPIPINVACGGGNLVDNTNLVMVYANFSDNVPNAVHTSGTQQGSRGSALASADWYPDEFLPAMKQYHKGPLVYAPSDVKQQATASGRVWAIYDKQVYDLSDYFYTITAMGSTASYQYLDSSLTDIWQQQPGQDITSAVQALNMNSTVFSANMACMKNLYYVGETDFRLEPRCATQGILLIVFSAILVATIGVKFLAALQLGTKRWPEPRDRFVILQVPCYTEGEDSLKKTIDSLATLKYDDKRKLLCVICDGMIVGSGNDRPTPRIVLDLLGADPDLDPEPLLFKSIGEGSRQLNYGKVYSGLYEHEGHVMPFIVIVKVGKPSERSRPGNRGKRDSQILLMRFLNRVHFDTEMCPLELEMYHHISAIIGVDPKLYEYMLCVDADTEVTDEALNRLVAVANDDEKIVGLCGETKLSNENESIWTMIQVYEYYISHHMAKAFESLFGSVTCLPGCFTLFRIRTPDKGRPLIISNLIIDDYSENHVDTLHKKNLLSLGEDRYLTTLLLKHFPTHKTKFAPDATALTAAPDSWAVLLSQRRRWINSTVHNLVELASLRDMCGICCFSMRFVVLIDLLGTIILPATAVYLVYLIVIVSTGTGTVPVISLIMLGAVYGLQAIIFLLKRQWQFIGWLLIYILAYPLYSFFLPIYSFWHFDDFSWGNTRIVVGEGKNKRVIEAEDETYDDSMIPMRRYADYRAQAYDMPPHDGSDDTYSIVGDRKSLAGSAMLRPPHQVRHASKFSRTSLHSTGQLDAHSRAPSYASFGQFPGMQTAPAFTPSMMAGPQIGFGYPMSMAGSVISPPSVFGGSQTGSDGGQYTSPTQQMPSMPMMQMPYGAMSTPSMLGYGMPPVAQARHMSMHSLAGQSTLGLGLGSPSSNPNPSDDELAQAVRGYLSSQDLLVVTKRIVRETMFAFFPNADLEPRKAFINDCVDRFVQGQL